MNRIKNKEKFKNKIVVLLGFILLALVIFAFLSVSKSNAVENLPQQIEKSWSFGSYNNSFNVAFNGARGIYQESGNDKKLYVYAYEGDTLTYNIGFVWGNTIERIDQKTGISVEAGVGALNFDPCGEIKTGDLVEKAGTSGTLLARVNTKGVLGLTTTAKGGRYGEFSMTMWHQRYDQNSKKVIRQNANDCDAKVIIRVFSRPSFSCEFPSDDFTHRVATQINDVITYKYVHADPFIDPVFTFTGLPQGIYNEKNVIKGSCEKAGNYDVRLNVKCVNLNCVLYDETFSFRMNFLPQEAAYFKAFASKENEVLKDETVKFETVFYDKYDNETECPKDSITSANSTNDNDESNLNEVTFKEVSSAFNDRAVVVSNSKIGSEKNIVFIYTVKSAPILQSEQQAVDVDVSNKTQATINPVFVTDKMSGFPRNIIYDTQTSVFGLKGSLVGSFGFYWYNQDDIDSGILDFPSVTKPGLYVKFVYNKIIKNEDFGVYDLQCRLQNEVGFSQIFSLRMNIYDSSTDNSLQLSLSKDSVYQNDLEKKITITAIAKKQGSLYPNPDVDYISSVESDKFFEEDGVVNASFEEAGERYITGTWHVDDKKIVSHSYKVVFYSYPIIENIKIEANRMDELEYPIQAFVYPENYSISFFNSLPKGIYLGQNNTLKGTFEEPGNYQIKCQGMNNQGAGNIFEINFVINELQPIIESVYPKEGLTTGNETVTITGKNFGNDMEFYFGTTKADVIKRDSSSVMVSSPAHPEGLVGIEVKNIYASFVLENCFYYYGAEPEKPIAIEDVPITNVHRESIIWAYKNNITTGYDSRHYCPNKDVNRGSMATFLRRIAKNKTDTQTSNPFSDISNNLHKDNILWAFHTGITTGYKGDKYAPAISVNRGSMATFLYRLAGEPEYNPSQEDLNRFSDISNSIHSRAIMWLAHNGITVEKNEYKPYKSVNRGSMATFLKRFYEKFVIF